jgi:hypothetical protein
MIGPTQTPWHARVLVAGIAGALAIGAIATLSSPAQARGWVNVGIPFPGYYPGPYYGYYPPPYYYAPPPVAYYPPAAYPADPGYAAPVQPAPSAYTPPNSAASSTAAQITYTNKPAFKNASGQTCREYTANDASGKAAYGTACQAADGHWRVAN